MALSPEKAVLKFQSDTWDSHRRRMAAWSSELARLSGSDADKSGLPHTLTADPFTAILDGPKRGEFLEDLGIEIAGPDPGVGGSNREMLELARALEDHFAWEPFEDSFEGDAAEVSPFVDTALKRLRCISAAELDCAIASLPVFPAAAQKAMQLLLADRWTASELQAIAGSDQVLAADLMRAANSCALGACRRVTTLGHAIAFIGAERASGILIAASVKPLFSATRLREIWNHSLEASETARRLAKLSKQVQPDEALLAGLVHDIGRLAMALLPANFQNRASNLLDQGCELPLVERVLCGVTHAEPGAKALERWRFPQSLVEAVRFHHRPERSASPMAAVLYLTETCANPGEDLPSPARSKAAMDRLRLDSENTHSLDLAGRILDWLRF